MLVKSDTIHWKQIKGDEKSVSYSSDTKQIMRPNRYQIDESYFRLYEFFFHTARDKGFLTLQVDM